MALYMASKDHDSTIAAFAEPLLVHPTNVATFLGRGGACLERKDYADAVADLTTAIQLRPGCAEAHVTRGTAYLQSADYERAIADVIAADRLAGRPRIARSRKVGPGCHPRCAGEADVTGRPPRLNAGFLISG